jgi:S-formylglutathione hydrolase FrmB
MWTDAKDGRVPMETIVIKELLPHIDVTFRTIASPDGRLIEGESMGGHGAARLGFKHPGVFGSVSILYGGPLQQIFDVNTAPRATVVAAQTLLDAVWGGDQEYYQAQSGWALVELNADAVRRMRAIRLIVGDQDPVLENNRKFDMHLTRLNIAHTFAVLPGVGHGPPSNIVKALGEEFFAFYRLAFSPPTR